MVYGFDLPYFTARLLNRGSLHNDCEIVVSDQMHLSKVTNEIFDKCVRKNMSDFCFVIIESLNRAPYLEKYLAVGGYKYDIVIWDRTASSENSGAEAFYAMYYKENKELNLFDKLIGYIKFSKYATRILKVNDYKGIFVFTPNVGILCSHILTRKYNKRFLLDIRDYWQEKHCFVYNAEKKLVKNSFANIISSAAYKKFLPEAEYLITHNSQVIPSEIQKKFKEKRIIPQKQLVMACIGAVKFIEYDKKVIDYFANDPRFVLKYIGKGYEQLVSYCEENAINNVYAEGMFPMNETFNKYEGVDVILNMYGNHNPKLDYALSNKLYFAAQLGKPILVCKDTYMEEVAVSNGFGFAIDLNDPDAKDQFYNYYNSINYDAFIYQCDSFMTNVSKDEENFRKLVVEFVKTCGKGASII